MALFRKKNTDYFRACNVYCNPADDKVIVASVFNHGGLIAEKDGQAVVTPFSDSSAIHDVISKALSECKFEPDFDYSHLKPSDWPAYKVSGYRTINEFESDFVQLHMRGVNDKNLFYEITSPEFEDFSLHIRVVVNAKTENYGEAVQHLMRIFGLCLKAVE